MQKQSQFISRYITVISLAITSFALVAGSLFLSNPAMAAPGMVATPAGAQPLGSKGGVFTCGTATVTVPANIVADGGYIHCGAFDPGQAPAGPTGYTLLRHTININIYNNQNQWVTSFNPPLTICFPYSDNELAAAHKDVRRLNILTAPINGLWSVLLTEVTPQSHLICARTDHLTLFDSALSGVPAVPLATATPAPTSPIVIPPNATTIFVTTPPTYVTFAYSYRYIVQPGDTLFRIALNFNTTVFAIQLANGLPSNFIYAGEALIVPTNSPYKGGSGVAPATNVPAPTSKPAASSPKTYTVVAGDNLFRIALRFNTTVAALQAANGLTSIYIYVGQVLILPGN